MQQLCRTHVPHSLGCRPFRRVPRLLRVVVSATKRHNQAANPAGGHRHHMTQPRTVRNAPEDVPHAAQAWEWFRSMGSPKLWVAPMVDQSELAFRMLCRRHGATGAYTPMLHSRLSLESAGYLKEHFTTCPQDRPLLAQFCANDPEVLLKAAKQVEGHVDGVDLNLGCPQRIAKRGKYGAFLMDDLDLVESLVRSLAQGLSVPVTVKIRMFPEPAPYSRTLEYAAMLERAGASLLAIHGRTREQKRAKEVRADWEVIKAVKEALHIPVLANGNITTLHDVLRCMEYTGADGVMSAEALLEDPALFSQRRLQPGSEFGHLDGCQLLLEYIDLWELYDTPWRMVKGHVFKLLGPWLTEFTDLRDIFNQGEKTDMSPERLRELTFEMWRRIEETGRTYPVPKLSARKLAAMEAEAAKKAAIEEQEREERALQQLDQQQEQQEQPGGEGEQGGGEAAAAEPELATAAA